ncbi:MAG TPA: DUF3043 domain-containing protein [Arachnia sp.]|mgnify:CR=1 FL=1|nr:DUF3043 domain-containing protein [Arachnia sp.]HMT87187.1 DUF3043 domain-containing protein [Arachnia sp.]
MTVGLFRPYERSSKQSDGKAAELTPQAPASTAPEATTTATGEQIVVTRTRKKEGATPTRRQAEAARMERLHPTLSPKERKKAERDARYQARTEAMERVERSPARALLRDYVDARWTISEFILPAMILIMAGSMAVMMLGASQAVAEAVAGGLWVLVGAAFINVWIMWRGYKRLLEERLPGTPTKTLGMYMFNRAIMIRRFRQPSPRIKRGDAF